MCICAQVMAGDHHDENGTEDIILYSIKLYILYYIHKYILYTLYIYIIHIQRVREKTVRKSIPAIRII